MVVRYLICSRNHMNGPYVCVHITKTITNTHTTSVQNLAEKLACPDDALTNCLMWNNEKLPKICLSWQKFACLRSQDKLKFRILLDFCCFSPQVDSPEQQLHPEALFREPVSVQPASWWQHVGKWGVWTVYTPWGLRERLAGQGRPRHETGHHMCHAVYTRVHRGKEGKIHK